MDYQLEVDFAPVYECVASLTAFFAKQNHGAMDAGKWWVKEVQELFAPATLQNMRASLKQLDDFSLSPYIWNCPGSRDVADFVEWFAGLSTGELYEISAACSQSVPANLTELRDAACEVLQEWNLRYFSRIDPWILEGLQQEACALRARLAERSSMEIYEMATNGMRLYPGDTLNRVVLIPQYHARPLVTSSIFETMIFTHYSCDLFPPTPGYPAPGLLRLTRALSDETRLRILRLLAGKQMTFTEIARDIAISKSTIHYHLIALRAAGLVIVHYRGKGSEFKSVEYSLRREALNGLNSQMDSYFESAAPSGVNLGE
ncbi:ArsR/SmtB family transcription factor [Paenibacillus phocaensis]|uniref:ArsR/SmtB family transcription factor n=1 Tax=Paenibacillus phocaensis TaxID=1776378 RepID=UPI000839CD52|nr:helix-turn-helix domain-containing protein [Paenibacillus phocaensis]